MIRRHAISFRHAFNGIIHALTTQPNFTIHLILSGLSLGLGIVFNLSSVEWLVLYLTITLGLVIEMLNTALESVVDLITDQHHLHAKHAKDIAAGAMLIYALGATLVGASLFLPRLF